jgi:hypothetical protein
MAATHEACAVLRRVTVIFEVLQPRARRSRGRSATQRRLTLNAVTHVAGAVVISFGYGLSY